MPLSTLAENQPPHAPAHKHMMPEGLFRQEALDYLNAPEPLDDLIEITPLHSWIAWSGIALFLGSVLLWGLVGKIPVELKGQGTLTRDRAFTTAPSKSDLQAELRVSSSKSQQIQPGMIVHLSPRGAAPELYGFLQGRVHNIRPLSQARINNTEHPVMEVEVRLMRDPQNSDNYLWTLKRHPAFRLAENTPCTGTIITAQRRPISLLFPGWLTSPAGKA